MSKTSDIFANVLREVGTAPPVAPDAPTMLQPSRPTPAPRPAMNAGVPGQPRDEPGNPFAPATTAAPPASGSSVARGLGASATPAAVSAGSAEDSNPFSDSVAAAKAELAGGVGKPSASGTRPRPPVQGGPAGGHHAAAAKPGAAAASAGSKMASKAGPPREAAAVVAGGGTAAAPGPPRPPAVVDRAAVDRRAGEALKKLQERDARVRREQETLELVRRELRDLEKFVQRDVDIIRDRIETEDRALASARKRHVLAKKEFEDASKNLEAIETRKNALTDHLTTILKENEARKLAHLEKIHSILEASGNSEGGNAPSATNN